MQGGTRGQGRRGPQRGGGPSICVCPSCGYEEKHQRGQPCSGKTCPECGSRLIGKWE